MGVISLLRRKPFQRVIGPHMRRCSTEESKQSSPGSSGSSVILGAEYGKTAIDGYTAHGFKVNSQVVRGSILCLPEKYFSWAVHTMEDLTVDSLAILDIVSPTPEMFILGCGARIDRPPEDIKQFLRERNIMLETVDTVNACQIFNVVNQEGRNVVGGIMALAQPRDNTGIT